MNERGGTSEASLEDSAPVEEITTPDDVLVTSSDLETVEIDSKADVLPANDEVKPDTTVLNNEVKMTPERRSAVCKDMASAACESCAVVASCPILMLKNASKDKDLKPKEEKSYLDDLMSKDEEGSEGIVVAGYKNKEKDNNTQDSKPKTPESKPKTIQTKTIETKLEAVKIEPPKTDTPQPPEIIPEVVAPVLMPKGPSQDSLTEVVVKAESKQVITRQVVENTSSVEKIEPSEVISSRVPEFRALEVQLVEPAAPTETAKSAAQQPQSVIPSQPTVESVRPDTIGVANHQPDRCEAYSESTVASRDDLVESRPAPTITQIEIVETEPVKAVKNSFSIEDRSVQIEPVPMPIDQGSESIESAPVPVEQTSVSVEITPASIEQVPVRAVVAEAEVSDQSSNIPEFVEVTSEVSAVEKVVVADPEGGVTEGHTEIESIGIVDAVEQPREIPGTATYQAEAELQFVEPMVMENTSALSVESFEISEQIIEAIDISAPEDDPEEVLLFPPTDTIDAAVDTPDVVYTAPDVAPAPDVVYEQYDQEIVSIYATDELGDTSSIDSPSRLVDGDIVMVRESETGVEFIAPQEVTNHLLDDGSTVEAENEVIGAVSQEFNQAQVDLGFDYELELADADSTKDVEDFNMGPEMTVIDTNSEVEKLSQGYSLTTSARRGSSSLSSHLGGVRQVLTIGVLAVFMALKAKSSAKATRVWVS